MDLSRTSRTPHRRGIVRGFGWLFAAGLLAFAALAPATVSAATTWATVDGYAAGTPENNHADTWGADCTKTADGADLGSTFTVEQGFAKIIVKAGSEESAPGHVNTIFNDVAAGETVWADSNGSGAFDDGDKGISHIIFCGPVQTTTTSTTTETETTSTGTESETTSTTTTETETTSTGTESETTSTTTTETETTSTGTESETTSTTSETTSTGTESSISTTTTASSTGQELPAVGTPGVTPPPTDTASVAVSTGSDSGFRVALVGLALIVMVLLLLQPKEAFVRNK